MSVEDFEFSYICHDLCFYFSGKQDVLQIWVDSHKLLVQPFVQEEEEEEEDRQTESGLCEPTVQTTQVC